MPDGKYTLDPAASALAGTEKMPIVQSASDKHVTPVLLRNFILGAVTPTELAYLTGLTANVQGQLNAMIAVLNTLTAFSHKNAVRVATTTNLTLSGLQTVDGVSLVDGDFCLVKEQTTKSENGIYIVRTSAWERREDFNDGTDLVSGCTVMVQEGYANADCAYKCISDFPSVGSSDIVFEEIGATDYITKVAAYTAVKSDFNKTFDCNGTFAFTLPPAVGIKGRKFYIKNSGSGNITVTPDGADTIDGAGTRVLNTQYEGVIVQSTGSGWVVVGNMQ